MASVDPIVQCAACGAKLRLKAASLKVLKQVRCGKCQAMIEIPEVLKSGEGIPEEPVVAKPPVTDDDAKTAESAAAPAPTPREKPAPAAPSPPPRPAAPPPKPAPSAPKPETPGSATEPASTPAPMPPSKTNMQAASVDPDATADWPAIAPDRELATRVDMLEAKVNAQQETIALLTAQIRQIVKAQATAVETAQAVLDR